MASAKLVVCENGFYVSVIDPYDEPIIIDLQLLQGRSEDNIICKVTYVDGNFEFIYLDVKRESNETL